MSTRDYSDVGRADPKGLRVAVRLEANTDDGVGDGAIQENCGIDLLG